MQIIRNAKLNVHAQGKVKLLKRDSIHINSKKCDCLQNNLRHSSLRIVISSKRSDFFKQPLHKVPTYYYRVKCAKLIIIIIKEKHAKARCAHLRISSFIEKPSFFGKTRKE
ncbi:hypothetical protein PPYR_07398 [Photinus pyralis]|uniref:Uncharacterized protein n=1 Tax=Photinus pyralis TaxID=7054 RepID=A0A5N4AQM7_PHOPY|nr:hypothetical protein PPYR_07398 [Photinus pyralis]